MAAVNECSVDLTLAAGRGGHLQIPLQALGKPVVLCLDAAL